MGLDISHDAWHGSYSAFNRWRNKLGEVAGYTFHETDYGQQIDLDWGGIESLIGRDLLGKWPAQPRRGDGIEDALIVLLAHSDCEGAIQHNMLKPLVNRLEELLPLLGDEDGGGHIGLYADATKRFINGARRALKEGSPLSFA